MNQKQKILQLHLYFCCLFSALMIFRMGTHLDLNDPQMIEKKSVLRALEIMNQCLILLHMSCVTLGKWLNF